MKNIFFTILLLPILSYAQKQNNFTINGKISGKADGMKVYLIQETWPEIKTVDSTLIKNGSFTFKGNVEVPVLYSIRIDKTPKGEVTSARNWLSSRFYLENSLISYSGNIDSLPAYYYDYRKKNVSPVITGSATQDEMVSYNKSRAKLSSELSLLDKEYTEKYHIPSMKGEFNSEIGIDLARRINKLGSRLDEIKWEYITNNPKSVVAYDQASYYLLGMSVDIDTNKINDLVSIIRKGWNGTPNMEAFEKNAEKAKENAIGLHYKDFELTTAGGERVLLSKFVPKGKIVMLEFWASWCGPCRAEIPHLKYLNETKSDLFSIVSISLDEKDADWRKAMKDEGMVWTQLSDPHGFEGEIAQAYNITGIPMSLVLDEDGRVMKVGLRGAFLDAYLEDLPAR